MKKAIYTLVVLAVTFSLYSCFKNPVTGRNALNLVSESEMRLMASQQYTTVLAETPPVVGTPEAEMVKRIGSRMIIAVNKYLEEKGQTDLVEGYEWEFNLVNSPEANAWCMPGGKVAVYTGILPYTATEAGLAVVMGHEIAHAIARHANERVSQQLIAEYGSQTLSAIMSQNPSNAAKIFNAAIGIGGQLGLLSFSRAQESEADKMGLIFMALAGYDPNEAVTFWQRMSQNSGTKPPEILSTHPSDDTRISNIKEWLPEAMKYYNGGQ